MVLKLSIRTLALPRWRQSHWDLRVTQDAYFSLLTHAKQLLLVTFCKNAARNGASFRTHGRRTVDGWQTDGRTDRPGSRNSYLDFSKRKSVHFSLNEIRKPKLCNLKFILDYN